MQCTTIVLFGITGDLAKKKLIPALYQYIQKNNIENLVIVGAAFEDTTINRIFEASRPFVRDLQEKYWETLYRCSYYKKMNFNEPENFEQLHTFVIDCEKKHSTIHGNRLFYCATSASFFCSITENITRVGLAQRRIHNNEAWHRIVYEKPFGHDRHSALAINECIARSLDESQVYRIDHYLTKEIVNNIAMIRFTNAIFEPLWSNRYIDQVQIVLSETIGIEGRGHYYDTAGAVRDVVQNHMLELLALVCMEMPEKLTGDCMREERAKVLEKVRFNDGILGQYDTYVQEPHVNAASTTETYASLQLFVDNARWAGVPFYLKTGKYLHKKETIIHIKFKTVDCLLMRGCPLDSNWLTIKIAPDALFLLTLNAKKPGVMDQVIPIGMEFCHSCVFGVQTPEAYEILFEEIIKGEQSVAVRFDEIEYAWNIVDTIFAQQLSLYNYQKGSEGPQEAEEFAQKHGMRWKS